MNLHRVEQTYVPSAPLPPQMDHRAAHVISCTERSLELSSVWKPATSYELWRGSSNNSGRIRLEDSFDPRQQRLLVDVFLLPSAQVVCLGSWSCCRIHFATSLMDNVTLLLQS